ncbi:transcription factor 20 isoform X2 [Archocentrus centrarchus]|uniref:transcription factor 20 isoform X2 n=1 Tax=Archocentrus centrarchus TaxID=63155 RepID=UPI0011EA3521|nr:transcription factor 20-like isoform X2 [Archocentrus centrarchus]
MEQPPGSINDLQPQDLSTSCIPTVIDLTRKGEECVRNSTATLDALRVVRSPGWFPNSGNSNPGLQGFSETSSSDIAHQSGDQIQPDNAFSHTTVTLSYVSRSHVFSVQDTLSQHSPLYSVPPISKFSLHPPCDTDKGLGETGYALNQHYLEQAERPVDLATQTELFQSLSQAQGGLENNVGRTQDSHECNSGVTFSDGDVEKPLQGKEDHSLTYENSQSLDNCNSGACAESSPEPVAPVTGKEEEKGASEVLFLMYKKPDQLVASDSAGARDLCSLSREYISPLEDPVSPSATSLDDVEDVFVLPQASSSPSGDNSYLETAEGVLCDSLSTEGASQPSSGTSDGATRLDSSDENKEPGHRRKPVLEPLIDLTDFCGAEVSENDHTTVVPHMNGSAKALERSLKKKRLPARSGRGTRLEAIVMNINSSRYKVSGCIRTSNKANASQSTSSDSTLSTSKRKDSVLAGKRKGSVKVSFSAKLTKQKAVTPLKRCKSNNLNTDSCKDSTSDSEMISNSKNLQRSAPPKSPRSASQRETAKREPVNVSHPVHPPQTAPVKSKRKTSPQSSPQFAVHKNSKKEPELLPQPDHSVDIQVARFSPPSKSPKKNQGKAKSRSSGSKTSPSAKTKAAHTPKRRRKKHKRGQSSSMFSPKEPEIKLKYVNYKEDKRDSRPDSFSPFIHVERQQSSPSLCTVINYPEEVRAQHKKGPQQQQANTSGFISALVPSTSCLQLGRVSTRGQHQRPLICCLCGQSANAMDLGDLHGPYYPEGYQPSTKTPASTLGLKEDDYSDSDSSSCSIRGRGRKCAAAPAPRALRPGAQLKKRGLLENHRRTGSSSSGSPAAKRARSDASSAAVEDWYSPPVLLLEPCEYWLHEDCGIWSAGVFLVKGKVYGLEEAVKVAQETVCSACHDPGAVLGCFFKGCPNKYHYRCALESDCVLIEENFSMKCKKHKNKTFKASFREQMGRKVTETS